MDQGWWRSQLWGVSRYGKAGHSPLVAWEASGWNSHIHSYWVLTMFPAPGYNNGEVERAPALTEPTGIPHSEKRRECWLIHDDQSSVAEPFPQTSTFYTIPGQWGPPPRPLTHKNGPLHFCWHVICIWWSNIFIMKLDENPGAQTNR